MWCRVRASVLLLAELDEQDQDVIATALYTAMRKGEVGGLLKTDLDLAEGAGGLARVGRAARREGSPGREEERRVRVVIDSSVVVAALATPNPESASRVVLAAVAAGAVQLVITDEMEAEYQRAVECQHVRRYAAKVDRQGFVDSIVSTAERVEAGSAAGAVPADPGDDKVVAAAFAGRAAFVVTLDRHLLELGGLVGVLVLRPGDFLRELRTQN